MIDFRYHLVSIVAVFLALAIGIVLGSTELQGATIDGLQSTSNSLHSQLSAASAERDSYQSQANASEQFLQTAEPTLLAGRLAGQRIVLVTEPGAPASVIDGVKQAAVTAGATVTGQVALQPKFNDISGTTESSLSAINGSVAASESVSLAAGANPQTTYQQQAAQLIATAILAKTAGKPGPGLSGARTLLDAYAQMGYLTASPAPTQTATLAVLVTPASAPPQGTNDPVNQVLLAVAQELATASAATVVAGSTTGSSQAGSGVSAVRSSSVSSSVSTVDNADTTLGQINVVEALAALLAGGKPNSYGISGASAVGPALPSPTATASATPHATAAGKGKVSK